jgi:AraC family transcriptional regulator of adaptative response / DNA-3-methyladenine glycosylase II
MLTNHIHTLACVPPLDWAALQAHYATRTMPGVDHVDAHRYCRTLTVGEVSGWLSVTPAAWDVTSGGVTELAVTLHGGLAGIDAVAAQPLTQALRYQFDLAAHHESVRTVLSCDPDLAQRLQRWPAPRLFGGIDPFEQAVRAVLGQRISVKAAHTLFGRVVERLSDPVKIDDAPAGCVHFFPPPQQFVDGSLEGLGITGARQRTLREIATAALATPDLFDRTQTLDDFVQRVLPIYGIGPWSAHYIAMRALGHGDAFPASDLGILKAMTRPGETRLTPKAAIARAEAWRPYRAYASVLLWRFGNLAKETAVGGG